MARLCGWLFFVLVAVVHQSHSYSHHLQKRQSRPSVDCSRQRFKTHDAICCQNSGKDIFLDAHLAACNPRRDRNLAKWANNYMLNNLQNFRKNNNIDLTDSKILSKICAAADFINCVYESNAFLFSNGSVNFESTTTHFSEFQDDVFWKTIFGYGETNFQLLLERFIPMEVQYITCPGSKSGVPPRNVSAIAFLWTQVVNGAFITNCPTPSSANRCKGPADNFSVCIKPVESYLMGQQNSKELNTLFDVFKFKATQ